MIQDWRDTIDEIHARGIYVMLDFTVGTLSDLIGFQGWVFHTTHDRLIQDPSRYLNMSAPFSLDEYQALWKLPNFMPWNFTEYKDFQVCSLVTFRMRRVNDPLRSSTSVTHPASSPTSGTTMARRCWGFKKQMVVCCPNSTNMVTWRLSVFTRTGNVSCRSSHQCKIVLGSGTLQ